MEKYLNIVFKKRKVLVCRCFCFVCLFVTYNCSYFETKKEIIINTSPEVLSQDILAINKDTITKKVCNYQKVNYKLYYYAYSTGTYRSTTYTYFDYHIETIDNSNFKISFKKKNNSDNITQINFSFPKETQDSEENEDHRFGWFPDSKKVSFDIDGTLYDVYAFEVHEPYYTEPSFRRDSDSGFIYFNPQFGVLVNTIGFEKVSVLNSIEDTHIPSQLVVKVLERCLIYQDIVDDYIKTN